METKFTKGPWVARGKTPSMIYGMLREDKEVIVAACGNVIEQAGANAHLIAAAPEMYEMLEIIAKYYVDELNRPVMKSDIEQLLAKARGEQ